MPTPHMGPQNVPSNIIKEKINRHKTSAGHKAPEDITITKEKSVLENAVSATNGETCCVFRTAHYVAKHDKPHTDHTDLTDLQKVEYYTAMFYVVTYWS